MIPRSQIAALVVVAVGAFVVSLWVSGATISLGWFGHIGITITAATVAITAFNLWLWKIPVLQGWLVKRPHLWGTWNVEIRSEWVDPGTGKRPEPISASFVIRQTAFALHLRMTSPKSLGTLVCADLIAKDDGEFALTGIYRNEPKLAERDRLEIHYGAFLLEIEGEPNRPVRLSGQYRTDRGTKGEMAVTNRRHKWRA